MLINIIAFLITVISMEAITWCTHKYVMHGFLWYLHEDHHNKNKHNIFEKNDLFFVIFAIPSMCLIIFGSVYYPQTIMMSVGLGIMMYGFLYFMVHEVIIHQRFPKILKTENPYLLGLRRAHKDHHKKLDKYDGVCFGMLFVPFKYFKPTKN